MVYFSIIDSHTRLLFHLLCYIFTDIYLFTNMCILFILRYEYFEQLYIKMQ